MKVLLFLSLFLLFSCQSEDATNVSLTGQGNQFGTEIKTLVSENQELQREMAQNVIFSGTSNAQRQTFNGLLVQTRVLLLQLLNNPSNKDALDILTQRHAQLSKMPIQARDEEFVRTYITGLERILDKISIHQGRVVEVLPVITDIAKVNMHKDLDKFMQIKSTDNTASFSKNSRNGEDYIAIAGFRDGNVGVNYLVSPPISLGAGENILTVHHTINHYKGLAVTNKYVQVLVGESKENFADIEWKEITFEKGPTGNNWNRVQSSWEKLNFENTDIKIAFRYESQKFNAEGEIFDPSLRICDEGEEPQAGVCQAKPQVVAPTWQILDFTVGVRE